AIVIKTIPAIKNVLFGVKSVIFLLRCLSRNFLFLNSNIKDFVSSERFFSLYNDFQGLDLPAMSR
ncbi:MAG: hypothetical protein ACYTXY_52615, partial [Nostoc sp.]